MRDETVGVFLDRLSRANGDPGGGAASGLAGAVAAALGAMVCGYTPDDPRAAEHADALRNLGGRLVDAATADGAASAALGAALSIEDSPGRDAAVAEAATRATRSSATLGKLALGVWRELDAVSRFGNPHLAADLSVAGGMVAAGIGGALTNLRGGLALVAAHADATALSDELDDLVASLLAARADARARADRLGEP